jgi:hypothetical protein
LIGHAYFSDKQITSYDFCKVLIFSEMFLELKQSAQTFYTGLLLAIVADRRGPSQLSHHIGQEGPGHIDLVAMPAVTHGSPARALVGGRERTGSRGKRGGGSP